MLWTLIPLPATVPSWCSRICPYLWLFIRALRIWIEDADFIWSGVPWCWQSTPLVRLIKLSATEEWWSSSISNLWDFFYVCIHILNLVMAVKKAVCSFITMGLWCQSLFSRVQSSWVLHKEKVHKWPSESRVHLFLVKQFLVVSLAAAG